MVIKWQKWQKMAKNGNLDPYLKYLIFFKLFIVKKKDFENKNFYPKLF